MKKAAAYIRVSTEEQTEYSPQSQLKAIRDYAQRNDILLCEEYIYIDEGISGRTAKKRPSFQKMIKTAKEKTKPFDVILIWKFSRFARNREDSIVYKSMLRKQCGIDVISVSEQLSEDKTSVLIEAMIEAMDEYYSLNLAEEVRRGMSEKFSRGGVISPPPFGYRMENGSFVPDELKSGIVGMIYRDYLRGLSMREIAVKLNDMGILTDKAKSFEARTVEYILTNPVYTGKLRRRRGRRDSGDRFYADKGTVEFAEGSHIPLINEDIFSEVQEKIRLNKRHYGNNENIASADYMMKGLVHCGSCGSRLVLQRISQCLQCSKYAKGLCGISHGISLKKINAAVLNRVCNDFAELTFNVKKEAEIAAEDSEVLNSAIENEKRKLCRIRNAYCAGVDTIEEYIQAKSLCIDRIKSLSLRLEKAESRREGYSCALFGIELLRRDDIGEGIKNIILGSMIDGIIYDKENYKLRIIYRNYNPLPSAPPS